MICEQCGLWFKKKEEGICPFCGRQHYDPDEEVTDEDSPDPMDVSHREAEELT